MMEDTPGILMGMMVIIFIVIGDGVDIKMGTFF